MFGGVMWFWNGQSEVYEMSLVPFRRRMIFRVGFHFQFWVVIPEVLQTVDCLAPYRSVFNFRKVLESFCDLAVFLQNIGPQYIVLLTSRAEYGERDQIEFVGAEWIAVKDPNPKGLQCSLLLGGTSGYSPFGIFVYSQISSLLKASISSGEYLTGWYKHSNSWRSLHDQWLILERLSIFAAAEFPVDVDGHNAV
ncbi:hypothetical protein BDZ91DRAFT_766589 [Kalaharituber pfeilii]|nr:hypothetical protein BDZ91DRAFT_766589 [Kalaharituber pfeilii]